MRAVLALTALVVAGWLGLHATVWSQATPAAPGFSAYGPVVAEDARQTAYPLAGVHGLLVLDHGCLTMHGQVVAWPYGTRWDATGRSVTFGGDSAGAAPVRVGHVFRGGGGLIVPTSGRQAWLSAEGRAPLRACLAATGARDVVLAYPSQP